MAAVLRMKLGDLLTILSKTGRRQKPGACKPFDETGLKAIQEFLVNGNAARRDLEFELNMSGGMVLRRLKMLRERGVVEYMQGDLYGLAEVHKKDSEGVRKMAKIYMEKHDQEARPE